MVRLLGRNDSVARPQPIPADHRDARSEAVARNLERVAWLMDRAFKIPGTRITMGLDALLGLLPVGGDVLTGLVQASLVLVALKHYRVPKTVAARMAANVLIDVAVGAIPLLGDLFDVAFKANTRNLKLLERYHEPPRAAEFPPAGSRVRTVTPIPLTTREPSQVRPAGTPLRYLLPIAVVLIAALAMMLIGFITIIRWLIR